jgi:signal transduction histidine kinase
MKSIQISGCLCTSDHCLVRHGLWHSVLLLVALTSSLSAHVAPPGKNVLFLHSFSRRDTFDSLEEIRQHCANIASDVQSLSHQLHSSKLDYLGITSAIRGFCKEFGSQHKVVIDFRDDNVPTHLPKDVSLCLFRAAQEALHNAVKYSGTRHFVAELRASGEEVQLTVSDAGAGFDVEKARNERGLVLVSMQERVHLVHGRFHIESASGAGSRIVAVVPLLAAYEAASTEAERSGGAATGAA